MEVGGKYGPGAGAGAGYPEQKYDPVQEAGAGAMGETKPGHMGGEGRAALASPKQLSPGSSPHHHQPQYEHAPPPQPPHDYLTPPSGAGAGAGAGGHVTPDTMRDIKPPPPQQQQPDTAATFQPPPASVDTDKEQLSESSIEAPEVPRSEDGGKSEYGGHGGLGGHEAGYGGGAGGGGGYYGHHADLAHPSYGGYSTAGPFPLSSPLARPRSNKNKSNSG